MIDVAAFGKPYWEDGEIRTFDVLKDDNTYGTEIEQIGK
jgi:hypothetical protein